MQTQNTETPWQSLGFASADVIQAMQEDMDFFAGTILPDDCTLAFPPEYRWIWQQMIETVHKERDFTKLAIGLPRGHGKTQVVKLFILFCILFSKKRYILIIGASAEKAEDIISDVIAMLDSENIQELFGNWRANIEIDRQDLKSFVFQGRKIILRAAGTGSKSIRGSNKGQARPDLMVFDDSQTSQCSASLTEAKAYQEWFVGTAMKAKSPKGCAFIYIGNMYKDQEFIPDSGQYTCLLRMLQKSPNWVTFIVGAILADGSALWEDLVPLAQLLAEYEDDKNLNQEAIFYAEVLNNPSGSASYYLDTDKIVVMRDPERFAHQGNFIAIDPATNKKTPDQMTFGYYEIYDNRPTLVELISGKFTGPESVAEAISMAIKRQCSLICVESNAYQYSLCTWFEFIVLQRGLVGLTIQDFATGTNKNGRILKMFQSLMKDEIRLTPATKSAVEHQGINFDPTKTNNLDDILDNLTMAQRISIEFRHLMHLPGDLVTDTQLLIASQDQSSYDVPNAGF